MVGYSNDQTFFAYKLLLTISHVSRIFKTFAIGSSADKKLLKIQLSKIIQLRILLLPLLFSPGRLDTVDSKVKMVIQ